jgi:FkbH-like protein
MADTDLYADLGWLVPAPADFKQRCEALLKAEGEAGAAVRALAGYALDENQLVRLARTLDKLQRDGRSLAPLAPFKLAIISNSTTNFLVPVIRASAARFGVAVDCVVAEYNQVMQSALDPNSPVNASRCDAVLLALDHRGLPLDGAASGSVEQEDAQVDAAIGYLASIRSGVRSNGGAISIVQTIARPPESLFGSFDRIVAGTWARLADSFNRRLAASVEQGDVLLDTAGIAETVGLANWHDPTQWNLAKLPFASRFLPLYGDHVGRLLGALRGKSRRVLILDLDNTVWSGVIGDDGVNGIVVGQGDPTGEAHLAVQSTALALRNRGIVLAVSSKNDDEVARLPFREHPDMLLREEHLAVFQANWNDKATNIAAIANELSLGLDSMVFLDDNPFEREFVRQSLPAVAVPELPHDPALYYRTLLASGYFEAVAFSAEDRKRAEFYQNNAKRLQLQSQAGDIEEYLRSLDMEIVFQPFDAVGRSRISQLINKSNQYNLTTRRYTEAEVAAAEQDPGVFTLQVRLRDRLDDNGMISVIICRRAGTDWNIDTWLMSCRVLGRRVENAVLRELLQRARELGIRRLVGRYIPTERNGMVRDHYEKLGFSLLESEPGGATTWAMESDFNPTLAIPMKVSRGEGVALA